MNCKRAIIASGAGLVLCLVPWLDRFFCGGDEPARADVVVVLAGGRYTVQRVVEGLRLVDDGYATNLIVSGVEFDPRNVDFAPEAMRLLEHRPVVIDNQSRVTRGTSLFVSQLARVHDWKRMLVVTSEFHWRRTHALFRYDKPPELAVHVCTVRDVDFSRWWSTPRAARLVKNELWFLLTFYLFQTPYGVIVVVVTVGAIVARRCLIP